MSLFPMAWMFLFTFGQEPALFARTPDISPDATKIVFSYLGDIWQANSDGKNAIPITSHPAHDYLPCYSPDGNWIAFSSNRHGSYDVFLLNSKGGKPKRLTHDSANDLVCGWSRDSKAILFSSNRAMGYPAPTELYSVSLEGGNPRRLTYAEAKEGAWHPKEPLLAYSRGPGAWYRKGYRGSANDELWIGKPGETGHVKLTNFNGQDGSAMWNPNGDRIYYVSEFFSPVANIVYQEPKPDSKPVQLTKHTSDSVRRARISASGKAIVYECGDSLYVLDLAPDSKPKKLVIPIASDDKTNPEKPMTFTQGASDFAISKDEQAIIYSVHGELFRMGNQSAVKAARLTDHPADDFGAVWAPDSSKAAFLSDRTGKIEIYLLESADTDHPKLMDAHQFKQSPRMTDLNPTSLFPPMAKKSTLFALEFSPASTSMAVAKNRLFQMAVWAIINGHPTESGLCTPSGMPSLPASYSWWVPKAPRQKTQVAISPATPLRTFPPASVMTAKNLPSSAKEEVPLLCLSWIFTGQLRNQPPTNKLTLRKFTCE
jgi:tricorn protease